MTLLKLLLLPTLAAAHFTLDAPPAIGPFDEESEGTEPCGGVTFDPSSANFTDYHVGGEPLAVYLGHPAGNWLFRVTTDLTANSNWSQIYPIFTQTGTGEFCQPAVPAPSSLVGNQGVLSVVLNGPDGLLYQCAAVNFVSGSGTYDTSVCMNATGVTTVYASDTKLTPLVSQDQSQTNGTSTSGTSSGGSSTTPGSSSSTSGSASGAAGLTPPMSGLAGSFAVVVVAGLVGAALTM